MKLVALVSFFIVLTVPAFAGQGTASWYSTECCKYNSNPTCPTASGKSLYELETFHIPYAAVWNYPIGTRLRVTNLQNGRSTIVEVLDRGPNRRLNRVIDLSKQAFAEIADLRLGTIQVKVEVV